MNIGFIAHPSDSNKVQPAELCYLRELRPCVDYIVMCSLLQNIKL